MIKKKGFSILEKQLIFRDNAQYKTSFSSAAILHQKNYVAQKIVSDGQIFMDSQILEGLRFWRVGEAEERGPVILTVSEMISESDQIPDHSITLEFTHSDSEELKN